MTPTILQLKNLGEQLARLDGIGEKRLKDGDLSAVAVLRASDGAKAHIIAELPIRKLVVTADAPAADSLARRIASWGKRVTLLPYRDETLLPRKSVSKMSEYKRVEALSLIDRKQVDAVVVSADALLQLFPARRLIREFSLTLASGELLSPQDAAKKLTLAGYTRQEMIGAKGEFALRGDILDVYAPDGQAYRANFFDELIEDVRKIDPTSMLSLEEVQSVTFPPVSDILLDEAGFKAASEALSKHITVKNAASVRAGLGVGAQDGAAVWARPFMKGCTQSLLEYFDDDEPLAVIFDEPKLIYDKLLLLQKEFDGRIRTLLEAGEITAEHKRACVAPNELNRQLMFVRKVAFSALTLSNPIFQPRCTIEPATRPITKYYLDPDAIAGDIKRFAASGGKVILACGNRERAKGVAASLGEMEIPCEVTDGEGDASVQATPLDIEVGVNYPQAKVVVIGTSECVGKRRGDDVVSQKRQFIAPKAGDYVVHRIHGIGLCEGTTLMKTGEFEREYIVLRYRDGDILYVATDQMNNLQKFIGEENPPLNKLGGKEFEREKEKVRKSVRKFAMDLVALYAKRMKQQGFKFSEDTIWQKEFEDSFEYEETADQLKALSDIKQDMEKGRIMDRLLVGDVGFGKTEVAFRAMFKTVMDGKQAVLLAPTTILARQHYENLVDRLRPFGIKCGILTRLQASSGNAKLLKDIKEGSVHMVIATHKVLSKDVEFYDLGLLVLDEEQRFGVAQKETLKQKYPLVNVLALSATPIPRTLNMSLSGIRDISMLETPPRGRLPVQTYVLPYSDSLVVDAITRETARGGQTLILLNDIDRLNPYAERLREMLEGVRIITAHGQMPTKLMEERVEAFYDKQYDVLIATTIIENGIDLPDANTLIVIDSGRFGLSQLYQLRGRVGRRGVLAHAYFTIPENGTLTDTAQKRLSALLENTEIGSGFRVALSDLSIRGAGTLLGAEQSGHIEKVGYEMYLEILEETVEEIKTGVIRKPQRECEMKVDIAAFIRDGYVSARDKLRVYRRISEVNSTSGRDALVEELRQVYGSVDKPLENLINISLLKNLASRQDVSRIIVNRMGAGANFYDADVFKNEALMRAVSENRDSCVMTDTIPPSLIFDVKGLTPEQKLAKFIEFFASV